MGYTRDENGLFMRGRLIEPLTAEHEAYGETLYLGKIEIMRLSGTADTHNRAGQADAGFPHRGHD